MAEPDDLVTTAEAAQILGRSVPTINRWAAEKRLVPFVKAPGKRGARVYRRVDVEAMKAEATA